MNIERITQDALFDFWKSVADKFPNSTGGDVAIELVLDLEIIATKAIKNWIENNTDFNSNIFNSDDQCAKCGEHIADAHQPKIGRAHV